MEKIIPYQLEHTVLVCQRVRSVLYQHKISYPISFVQLVHVYFQFC